MRSTTYKTTIIGHGQHAAIEIPDTYLVELGTNKRAPLKITVNGHTYQNTATGVDGKCMVVFPLKERKAAQVESGETVSVTLELDSGYRLVEVPAELEAALDAHDLSANFKGLSYSRRKEYARQIREANSPDTKQRRVKKIILELSTDK